MGTITKRTGKTGTAYKVQIRRKGHETQTATFDTRAKAERWARSIEAEIESGRFSSPRLAQRTTLNELLQRYDRTEIFKKSDPEKERSFIRLWSAQKLAQRALTSIQSSDFAALRDEWLGEGYKPSTVTRRLRVISHVYTVARKEWKYGGLQNPLLDVTMPTIQDARERVLKEEPQQLESVDEESEDDELEPTDRANIRSELEYLIAATESKWIPAAIGFAVQTAMRRSEIVALTWSNVNFRTSVAHLPRTKNGSARNVPLSPEALQILHSLKTRASSRVFDIRADSLTKAYRRALARARMKYLADCESNGDVPDAEFLTGLRFHDLRHEATTRLAKIFQLHELAKITGHKTPEMLMRYYHPKAADLAKRFPGATL